MRSLGSTKKGHVTQSTSHHASTESAPAAPAPEKTAPAGAGAATTVVTKPADPAVTECNALLDRVLTLVGTQTSLDATQVRRSTKMRKGGAEVIAKILALCQQHGITQVGTLTTQEMSDELARGDALEQVGVHSGLVQKKVRESAMTAHGRSWQIGTTLYTTLQRMAKNDPELALGLQSVEEFFQTKRTKGKVRANKKASAEKHAAPVDVTPAAPAGAQAAPVAAGATAAGH
jgi:hypothetical protein